MAQGFGLRPVHALSGGQRQRVAIAGALAEQPQVLAHNAQRTALTAPLISHFTSSQVLLLDELTTYLDPEDQQGVLDAVRAAVDGPRRVTAIWVRLDRAVTPACELTSPAGDAPS